MSSSGEFVWDVLLLESHQVAISVKGKGLDDELSPAYSGSGVTYIEEVRLRRGAGSGGIGSEASLAPLSRD